MHGDEHQPEPAAIDSGGKGTDVVPLIAGVEQNFLAAAGDRLPPQTVLSVPFAVEIPKNSKK